METLSPNDLAQMFQAEAYGVRLEESYAKRYPHPVERAAMLVKLRSPQSIALVHEWRLHRLFITESDLDTLNALRWSCRDGDYILGFRKVPVRMDGVHAFFGRLCSWNYEGSSAHADCVRCEQNHKGVTSVQFVALIAARLQSAKLQISVTTCGAANSPRLAPDVRPVPHPRFRELEASVIETKAQLAALRREVNSSEELAQAALTKAERAMYARGFYRDPGDWWKPGR